MQVHNSEIFRPVIGILHNKPTFSPGTIQYQLVIIPDVVSFPDSF